MKLFRITTVPISLQKLISGQLPFMKSHGFEPIMLSAMTDDVKQLVEDQECVHVHVPLTRKITPLADLKALWLFYRLCKVHKPDIIHSHSPKAGIIGMLGGKMAGVPVRLHTVAGLPLMETHGKKRKILELVEVLTYACATKVYPNSTVLKEFILDMKFCEPSKVKVIGNGSSNGINTTLFNREKINATSLKKLQESLQLTEKDFVFVFVGRIVKDKGIQELVSAFTSLQIQHPHIKLLLVGPMENDLDPLDDNTLKVITQNPGILSVGYQNDVRYYLALSKALVFPSYREGFPNVPMQAGCFNLPSIVTDINGCNEIIVSGKNGLIIPPKSVEALNKAMEKMLLDTTLYKHLQANARRMIVERYEQCYFWELLLNEYREQIANINK